MGVFKSLATSLLALCLCIPSIAEQVGQIKSMKLLTPDIGWASTSQKLFWTADAGAHWKDITPKLHHKWQIVSSVFFIDSSSGWVVLKCADRTNNAADDPCFEVASTTNAGETWSVVHPKIVDPDPDSGFSEQAYLDFADKNRGWMILKISKNVAVSSGVMMRTEDGGKTWKQMPAPPIADQLRFINAEDGWMAGGPDQELYSTHDAGDSWQRVSLPDPKDLAAHLDGDYSLPVFQSATVGSVAVQYALNSPEASSQVTLALFATTDGGGTWARGETLSNLPTINDSDVEDSALIAAHSEIERPSASPCATETAISLFTISPGQTAARNNARLPFGGALKLLSFTSGLRGWAEVSGRLFQTVNAGQSWKEITPGGPPRTLPGICIQGAVPKTEPRGKSSMGATASAPAHALGLT